MKKCGVSKLDRSTQSQLSLLSLSLLERSTHADARHIDHVNLRSSKTSQSKEQNFDVFLQK
jgi:hypothetical protein